MALAECTPHTAPRRLRMARAGRVDREENIEPTLLDPPLPKGQVCSTSLSTLTRARHVTPWSRSTTPSRPCQCLVIEVPKIIQDHTPQSAVLREPRVAEQLVPVPQTVILAHGKDDRGTRWCHVARRSGSWWWMVGSNYTRRNRPEGLARPWTKWLTCL